MPNFLFFIFDDKSRNWYCSYWDIFYQMLLDEIANLFIIFFFLFPWKINVFKISLRFFFFFFNPFFWLWTWIVLRYFKFYWAFLDTFRLFWPISLNILVASVIPLSMHTSFKMFFFLFLGLCTDIFGCFSTELVAEMFLLSLLWRESNQNTKVLWQREKAFYPLLFKPEDIYNIKRSWKKTGLSCCIESDRNRPKLFFSNIFWV